MRGVTALVRYNVIDSLPKLKNKRLKHKILIENDHLGDWSAEKDCGWRLSFRQPVRKPSSESSDSFQ